MTRATIKIETKRYDDDDDNQQEAKIEGGG